VVVLEQRAQASGHSRSIGIHPPALEVLALAGLAEPLLERGVRITRARAFAQGKPLGVLELGGCPAPYRFVLSVPQPVTDSLLALRLEQLAPGSLLRGSRLEGLSQDDSGVTLQLAGGRRLRAALVAGCDGRGSSVRRLAGIARSGGPHSDHYVMADLPDSTDLGLDAAIYLTSAGVVESFPLPDGRRRWVVRTGGEVPARTCAALELLVRLVRERTGLELSGGAATVSVFTAETLLLRSLTRGRLVLAGDAAHVIPPIGGQGLNLGWLGAERLARALAQAGPDSSALPAGQEEADRAGADDCDCRVILHRGSAGSGTARAARSASRPAPVPRVP
jgi:2-polyprenyl-6-methoxyphenol hydroxylase-like FAD-dependent oxidoreductase